MNFVDEVNINVEAGKGGNGACSFLRLKFMPFGGPDGGDGGKGGSVFLQAEQGIHTLVDYRFVHTYKAENGERGKGRNCTGKSGRDLVLKVPVGTMVYDKDTGELIADLAKLGQQACVAQGGKHGIGNARFKSSVDRAPRRTVPGQEGEKRHLHLELKVLADVGLVGLPNAGKSTLLRALSAARPKVADYPFTTLSPCLGTVRASRYRSFVIADLPGLIEGAAEGVGLGTRFLKHVARTLLLFHVVDVAPADGSDPVANVSAVVQELAKFDKTLLNKERWLLLNKVDLLAPGPQTTHCEALTKRFASFGFARVFVVSGLNKLGLEALVHQAMDHVEKAQEVS